MTNNSLNIVVISYQNELPTFIIYILYVIKTTTFNYNRRLFIIDVCDIDDCTGDLYECRNKMLQAPILKKVKRPSVPGLRTWYTL